MTGPAARDVATADPDRLRAVLGWLLSPRRGGDGLRRACRDDGGLLTTDDGSRTARLDAVLASHAPSAQVRVAVERALDDWADRGVRATTIGDRDAPDRLARGWPDRDVPALLAWRGVPVGPGPSVAIVGSRAATGYGRAVAAWLAGSASTAGVRVVSGGARGIDAAAHEAALEGPGGTTVVLGCGHGVAYPRDHARPGGLFDRILDADGTVLSELPPQVRPHPGTVRARNRIVAALADVVVVVEGGARSGALLTASAAADLGVTVLAVPGDVRAPGSVAPHRLLAEGVAPCTSPADLLEAVRSVTGVAHGAAPPGPGGAACAPSPAGAGCGADGADREVTGSVLPDAVHRLLAEAWPRPVVIDDLAARTGRPAAALLGALTRAQVAGEVAQDATGVRLRRAPVRAPTSPGGNAHGSTTP